jgi:outer membrane immunogenic protein
MGDDMSKRHIVKFALLAALFGAGAAQAADLQRAPVYTKAPPAPVEVFNWTGFYIGANLGYSAGRAHFDTLGSTDLNGVVGGGQIGYNWQGPGSPWVFGVEVDGQATGQDNSATAGGVTLTESLPWFVTFRGRVGYAFAPMFMIYATGGGAWVDHKFELTGVGGSLTSEVNRLGWTAGAGIEGALNRNWSWKVEYLHLDTGSFNTNVFGVLPVSLRVTDEIGRFGINYRF